MGASVTLKDVSQDSVYCDTNFAKHSRIVVFASIFLKLHLFVLFVLFAASLPLAYGVRMDGAYVYLANRLSRLFNGCNLSPNHVFLVLNSIIAAIAATSKMSRAAADRIETAMANNPEIKEQSKAESVRYKAQQLLLRPTEPNSDISVSQSKTREACPEFGVEEQEQLASYDSNHDREDGFNRVSSPRRVKATKEVLDRSINCTKPEPPLPAAGDSVEEIWRAIASKSRPHSSDRQIHESKSHLNNQAVRRAPTLTRLASAPNSYSRCVYELREVPELNCKSLGREPSTGLEELNRKAEEFIARFSEQIRVERQASIIRCMGMADTANCS